MYVLCIIFTKSEIVSTYIYYIITCVYTYGKTYKTEKEPNLQNEMLTKDQTGGKNKTYIY